MLKIELPTINTFYFENIEEFEYFLFNSKIKKFNSFELAKFETLSFEEKLYYKHLNPHTTSDFLTALIDNFCNSIYLSDYSYKSYVDLLGYKADIYDDYGLFCEIYDRDCFIVTDWFVQNEKKFLNFLKT